jgi:methylase of polypeptide subunit release factors
MDARAANAVETSPRLGAGGAKLLPTRGEAESFVAADRALLALGQELKRSGYRFTAITPVSHRRVLARKPNSRITLEDIFGWNRPFRASDLSADLGALFAEAATSRKSGALWRSGVRFATLDGQIFAHSGFPTDEPDAVFFGPDTYRFARLIRQSLATFAGRPHARVMDIGAGSGAGGLYVARLLAAMRPSLVLTDINVQALRFCRINTALNGATDVQVMASDLFNHIDGTFDLIVANPPYLVDPLKRLYRHGGGEFGAGLSLDIVEQGVNRLAPGGRLLLYTGSASVAGEDQLHEALKTVLAGRDVRWSYEEIDPDVFGEELDEPPYDRADRIAVVAVTIDRCLEEGSKR